MLKINIRKAIYATAVVLLCTALCACGFMYDPPESYEELAGTNDETTYNNDYLGFSLSYPEGYTILASEEIDELMAQTIEYIKSAFTDTDQQQKAIRESTPVAMGLKNPLEYASGYNSNFYIVINEASAFDTADIVKFADKSTEAAEKQTEDIEFDKAAAININGKEAALSEGIQKVGSYEALQKRYFFASKNYCVAITFSSTNEEDMNELTQIIDTIQFDSDL